MIIFIHPNRVHGSAIARFIVNLSTVLHANSCKKQRAICSSGAKGLLCCIPMSWRSPDSCLAVKKRKKNLHKKRDVGVCRAPECEYNAFFFYIKRHTLLCNNIFINGTDGRWCFKKALNDTDKRRSRRSPHSPTL